MSTKQKSAGEITPRRVSYILLKSIQDRPFDGSKSFGNRLAIAQTFSPLFGTFGRFPAEIEKTRKHLENQAFAGLFFGPSDWI